MLRGFGRQDVEGVPYMLFKQPGGGIGKQISVASAPRGMVPVGNERGIHVCLFFHFAHKIPHRLFIGGSVGDVKIVGADYFIRIDYKIPVVEKPAQIT